MCQSQSVYQSHWGLEQSPFHRQVDCRHLYHGPMHEEALARLRFLVNRQCRCGLLLGKPGVGKSLLLRSFAVELSRRLTPVVRLHLPGLDVRDFLWKCAAQLGSHPAGHETVWRLRRRVCDALAANQLQWRPTVILLDDANEASDDVLLQIARLAEGHGPQKMAPTLVLATRQTDLRLFKAGLLDRIALRIDLDPWSETDTRAYLDRLLCQAGRSQPIFDEEAVSCLHQLSGGIARHLNRLADLALWTGALARLHQIGRHTIRDVFNGLDRPEEV